MQFQETPQCFACRVNRQIINAITGNSAVAEKTRDARMRSRNHVRAETLYFQ